MLVAFIEQFTGCHHDSMTILWLPWSREEATHCGVLWCLECIWKSRRPRKGWKENGMTKGDTHIKFIVKMSPVLLRGVRHEQVCASALCPPTPHRKTPWTNSGIEVKPENHFFSNTHDFFPHHLPDISMYGGTIWQKGEIVLRQSEPNSQLYSVHVVLLFKTNFCIQSIVELSYDKKKKFCLGKVNQNSSSILSM